MPKAIVSKEDRQPLVCRKLSDLGVTDYVIHRHDDSRDTLRRFTAAASQAIPDRREN